MENNFDIKKEYEKLRKKHNLPSYDKINNDFELDSLQNLSEDLFLRLIRRRMNEKIIFFCRILEEILHPNASSIISLHETKFKVIKKINEF